MEHDTIIMSLIYIERLLKETPIVPTPTNWRSVLFASMVLASKVWDDLSMWNVDFSNVCSRNSAGAGSYPSSSATAGVRNNNNNSSRLVEFTLPRINQLELALLKSLNFNVKVPASQYAKYYFLIRSMLIKSGLLQDEVIIQTSTTTATSTTPVTTTTELVLSPERRSPPQSLSRHRGTKSVDDACIFLLQSDDCAAVSGSAFTTTTTTSKNELWSTVSADTRVV